MSGDLAKEGTAMLGAIAGDVIGSVHEHAGTKSKDFPLFVEGSRFTDDTVLTVAVAERLLRGGSYIDWFHEYFHAYPHAGYGSSFRRWAQHRCREPYRSWGNGSAMRVSPIGIAGNTLEEVLAEARASAEVTHNHPQSIRGAQATAAAVFLARSGYTKADIKAYIEREFGYNLSERLDDIRERYGFDVSCQGSVPQAIIAFLEAGGFEDAVRNAISLGGDADTMACIAGGIAEAFFGGVPDEIASKTLAVLDERLRGVVREFQARFVDRLARPSIT
ncbi:ADP-ribosylglycohydrolase family protein [Synechococcus sp. B60.1]|uniref:ADP-ribosylglycohydrolase family protein n=1 Tax=Synechococcus sp. B60.1 TaxID=2964522 RepID=UPI0039C20998